jgi:hypothetical protein
VSEKDIRKWFTEIRCYIDEEDLFEVIQDPRRVFNADETGFNICPKTGKVLAEKGCKNVYEIEKGPAKENITVLFTFSAAGSVCSPLIIYPYKRIPDRVTMSVPPAWGIGRSETGWMTASVFYDYIANCFYNYLRENCIPLPVILFVDGHKTHLTLEVAELCRTLKIHLIALYPNATRILQPADVAAFRPIKVGWRKTLREWYATNNYQINLTKENFAPLLKTVVDSCAKPETLMNGFRISGLYPFDPDNVDYSKCLAIEKETEQPVINKIVLMYSEFCDLVGSAMIAKCEATTGCTLLNEDDSFIAIYNIWQKFKCIENNKNSLNTRSLDPEENDKLKDNEQILADVSCHLIFPEDNYFPDIFLDESTGYLVNKRDLNMTNKENTEVENNVLLQDNSPLESIKTDSFITIGKHEKTDNFKSKRKKTDYSNTNEKDDETVVSMNMEKKEIYSNSETMHKNLEITQITKPDIANGIEPGPSKLIDSNKKINIISNEPLSEYLKKKSTICSPKRKGKRQTEKLPFALTSNYCVELMKEKITKKQEEEAAKQERKRLREEKKIQKDAVPKKIPKRKENKTTANKVTNKNKLACCDYCLSPINKRIIACSQCKKIFHFNCIPSSHRQHIPENDDNDPFMCHMCYRESNTDTSDNDSESVFAFLRQEMENRRH